MILVTINNMRKSTRILLGLHKKFRNYNTLNRNIDEVYMVNHRVLMTISNTQVSKGKTCGH
jgi:beta-N-acetylglucosaminidase